MISNDLDQSNDLVEILPSINEHAREISLLCGDGGGWGELLAWNPDESLAINSVNDLAKIDSFIASNLAKKRIVIGFLAYDLGLELFNLGAGPNNQNIPLGYIKSYSNFATSKDQIPDNIIGPPPDEKSHNLLSKNFELDSSVDNYINMFNKAKDYIARGHIYQVNLAQWLNAETESNPRLVFKHLAKKNIGMMKGYFEGPGYELLSVSPERFIKTDDRKISTYPIKGTKSFVKNSHPEVIIKLTSDPKEISELNMITDLLRNDLSAVCRPGSVKVTSNQDTQSLSSVVHTFSTIVGELEDNLTPMSALVSMFPGGSITGCPKKRSMEIIDELEQKNRGAYCGSMFMIDQNGNLDSNIMIRTIIKNGRKLELAAGGGIVFDSEQNSEYQETLDKAEPIITSLN